MLNRSQVDDGDWEEVQRMVHKITMLNFAFAHFFFFHKLKFCFVYE